MSQQKVNTSKGKKRSRSASSGSKMPESRKKEQKNGSKNSFLSSLRNTIMHDTTQFIIGLLLLLLSIFVFLGCVGYLFTAAHDQSVVQHAINDGQTPAPGAVNNVLQEMGAYTSDLLIDKFLGVGSFLLVLFVGYMSLGIMRVIKRPKYISVFVFLSATAIWLSLFAATIQTPFMDTSTFLWGGIHGKQWVQWLLLTIGWTGLILLLLFLFIVLMVLLIPKTKEVLRKLLAFQWIKKIPKKSVLDDSQMEEGEAADLDNEPSYSETTSFSNEEPQASFVDEDGYADEATSYSKQDEAEPSEQQTEHLLNDEQSTYEDAESHVYSEEESHSHTAVASQHHDDCEHKMEPSSHVHEQPESKLIIEKAEGDELSALATEPMQREESPVLAEYSFPPLSLLNEYDDQIEPDRDEIKHNEQLIIDTLESFKIRVTPIKATVGPTVTLYEIEPDAGIKIARIKNLEEDIARCLKADGGIRIIAPIPGKGTIGIEVPNKKQQTVGLRNLLASRKFTETDMLLPIALGRTITNEVFMFDLAKMPHLLIAGATGQGKSVGMNVVITSLLYSKHPSELKFVMVDPKILEFSLYASLEDHYFARLEDEDKSIITEPSKVLPTLLSLCVEMDNRYERLKEGKVRNIAEYNSNIKNGILKEEDGHTLMPYIVLVVDEYADLMVTGGKEIEKPIQRLAQKARAAGIHMILATQRPTTDIVTGTIKANFPARIAFKVFSAMDSKTILDATGANRLIGRGDMLFYQGKEMIRVQSAFVDTPETKEIVDYIAAQPGGEGPYILPEAEDPEQEEDKGPASMGKLDPLFEEVARMVVTSGQGSTSKIQSDFEIGFNRARRIMNQLEKTGIVGKQKKTGKPREVLVNDLDTLNQIFYRLRNS